MRVALYSFWAGASISNLQHGPPLSKTGPCRGVYLLAYIDIPVHIPYDNWLTIYSLL